MIYTVGTLEDIIRTELNEYATTRISAAEVLAALNDAQLQVATRSLCIEKEILEVTVSGRNTVKSYGIRTNFVELISLDSAVVFTSDDVTFEDDDVEWNTIAAAADLKIGMQCILPTNIGSVPFNNKTYPEYWFNWGEYLVIEPVPDARYILKLYYSDYPAKLTDDASVLEVPKEFHQCVIDYTLYLLSIKLQRWTSVAIYYNKYITSLQMATVVYVRKFSDARASREIPKQIKGAD